MQQTFIIGVVVDPSCSLRAWEVAMLKDCFKKNIVHKVVLLVQKKYPSSPRINFLVRMFQLFENAWFHSEEDASRKEPAENFEWVHATMDADDAKGIAATQLDLIYSAADACFNEVYNGLAKYGLWRVVFGERKYFDADLPAFWEVMDHSPVTGSHLLVYRKAANPTNVYSCSTATVPYSVKNNFNSIAWKSSCFLAYRLHELATSGEKLFFDCYQPSVRNEQTPMPLPGNLYMFFLFFRNGFRYLRYKLARKKRNRFTLAFTTEHFDVFHPEFKLFSQVSLPSDTFYADPFPVEHEQQPYIFFENFDEKKAKGAISVLAPDNSIRTVLQKPVHLSYPFVFSWNGNYWMIPESADAKNVQLYQCKKFPDQWVFVRELLSDCVLIDATILLYQDKWWMFGVTSHHPACNANDQLMLYYTDDLLHGEWLQHPQNPVATNIANCRPAGKIFEQNGKLYRPAQNNASFQYGYGICINEIEVMNETRYQEKLVLGYLPGVNVPYRAIHTINKGEKITVIDAIV
jgi:hypothetical protein